MFHLDHAIAAWRRSLRFNRAFSHDDLDELEAHLRDYVEALVADGLDEETAFHQALQRLGPRGAVEMEYRKVRWSRPKRRRSLVTDLFWNAAMLKNYLTIALRTLRKHKGYAAINVLGLALGIACCLLIGLYVQEALRFDRFHAQADRIYRIVESRPTPDGPDQHVVYAMGPLGPALVEQVPGVVNQVRLVSQWSVGRRTVTRGANRFYEADYLFVEPSFFDVFDFPLLAGDPATALDEPNEVVLSEAAVQQYFGEEDPMGKTLEMEQYGTVTVTGIIRIPATSHLDFSMLVSLPTLTKFEGWANWIANWYSTSFITYLVLEDGTAPQAVEQAIADLLEQHRAPEDLAARTPYLQALTDIHLGSAHIDFDRNHRRGNPTYLYLFSIVALFVLLIACINYVNMATAQSMQRAKEVGLRKTVGAYRGQLVAQFLSESLLIAGIAAGLGFGLAWLVLPFFNDLAGTAITLDLALAGPLLGALLGGALLVGLIAGGYPAFVLSRFRPAHVLKGAGVATGGTRLRQAFVVVQFALSIGLLVATAVVYRQMQYVQQKDLGYDQEQLVAIDINSGVLRSRFAAVKDELARVPAVQHVAVSSRVPGDWKGIPQIEIIPENAPADQRTTMHFLGIDADFLATYAVPLTAGRNFDEARGTDSTAVLVNQTAARMLGGEVVGRRLTIPGDELGGDQGDQTFEIVGVVEDFHYQSLHEAIGPMVLGFRVNPVQAIDYFTVRLQSDDLPAIIAQLRAIGERFDPEHPFEYNFLDQRLRDFYANEQRVARLFSVAAGLAVVIACLGLFALASFTTERRRKEIGVRKVLGASVGSIVLLLSREFAVLVALAFLIAAPATYWLMGRWLQDFSYRTAIGPGTLLLAGGAALLIALATVGYRTVRAALRNPVESLRYE